jgi:hypothetical protein
MLTRIVLRRSFIAAVVVLGGVARAQQQPAAPVPPAPNPPRYQLVVPPGFEKVTVAGHTAVCQAKDLPWVRQALGDVKPATRPATMPADLLRRIKENRAAVTRQIVTDFAAPDDKGPNRLFDELLIPTLTRLDELRPPVFLLVCTQEELRALVADGWGAPRFRYNRVAHEVSYDARISLAIDRPMDDQVLPATYAEKDPPDARARRLVTQVQKLDQDLARTVANESLPAVFNRLGQFIDEEYFVPLKLRRDQVWLAMGVNGYFSGKYGATLTGYSREAWIRDITYEDRRFPVSARPIDLTRPADERSLKAGAAPYYAQAMRRTAVAAVVKWVAKAGEPSVTKVIAALRQGVPTDGPALVKLIRDVAGVDVSKDLAPQ